MSPKLLLLDSLFQYRPTFKRSHNCQIEKKIDCLYERKKEKKKKRKERKKWSNSSNFMKN